MYKHDPIVKMSKFLSSVLRHAPEKIGLVLDAQGWASVEHLLEQAARHGRPITREQLQTVVERNDKRRFVFSADGRAIRANQGHSIAIDLGLEAREPPPLLYHGSAERFLASIRQAGLWAGFRNHVHLSADIDTAMKVGSRHGKPVVLPILAQKLAGAGQAFYLSENGVWLTADVKPEFIDFEAIRHG